MTASTLVPFALLGRGEGVKQTLAIEGSPLSFAAEGHRAFGGTDSAPSPLDFALGAPTSCPQVTGQIVASGNPKIALGRWEVAVKANLDGAVLLKGGEGVSNSGMSISRYPWRQISTTTLSLGSPKTSNTVAR
jgi:putative redox protein